MKSFVLVGVALPLLALGRSAKGEDANGPDILGVRAGMPVKEAIATLNKQAPAKPCVVPDLPAGAINDWYEARCTLKNSVFDADFFSLNYTPFLQPPGQILEVRRTVRREMVTEDTLEQLRKKYGKEVFSASDPLHMYLTWHYNDAGNPAPFSPECLKVGGHAPGPGYKACDEGIYVQLYATKSAQTKDMLGEMVITLIHSSRKAQALTASQKANADLAEKKKQEEMNKARQAPTKF